MASTIAFYTGDGTTTDFTVPFDYLAKKFVRVSLGVTILKGGDYGDTSKDYYFLDKTKVRLKVPPQEGEVLTIRRYTSATDRVVSFKDASVLKATDLDVSSVQTIHIAEESRDIINDALIKDKEGNWDARGHRIVNVGDPIGDTLFPTYAKKQAILDACDKALNGTNPVNAGDPTLDEIKSSLATIQAQLAQLESRRYVKETGKSSDGSSWYRKWSDGWIEQGGITQSARGATSRTINLRTPFSSINYVVVVQSYTGGSPNAQYNNYHVAKKSLDSFSTVAGCGEDIAALWYACGY